MHQIYTSTGYFNIINQIMNCLFNEIHNYQVVFLLELEKYILNLHVVSPFKRVHLSEFQSL